MLEFILLIIMLAITMAVVINNTNFTIYCYWTGLAHVVALPCPGCKANAAPPGVEECTTPK